MTNHKRYKDSEWTIPASSDDTVSFEGAQLCVLMDIRDELKRLNGLFHCLSFINIPRKLDDIRRNTAKKRKRRV